jgi:mRNA interferase MazF
MKLYKGDIYWVKVFDETGKIRDITHPHIVLQETLLNQSRIDSIVVCALSTNMKRVNEPGNILLNIGEGNLPKQSIIVVSQISIAQKKDFGEFIGCLSEERIRQIFSGIKLIQSM